MFRLEYRFKSVEYNSLKGTIGEHLARSYIRNHLAARIIKEDEWDHVLLSRNDYKYHTRTWNKPLFSYDTFRKDFIVHGFYANKKLLSRYATVVGVLEQNHCTPDGLLLKLRETGKMKRLKESFSLPARPKSRKHKTSAEYPIVEGDLEVVEIKCGRHAKLMSKQKETYNDLVAKGIPLRMVKVRFVSFDLNRFLVEEHRYERFL